MSCIQYCERKLGNKALCINLYDFTIYDIRILMGKCIPLPFQLWLLGGVIELGGNMYSELELRKGLPSRVASLGVFWEPSQKGFPAEHQWVFAKWLDTWIQGGIDPRSLKCASLSSNCRTRPQGILSKNSCETGIAVPVEGIDINHTVGPNAFWSRYDQRFDEYC